MRETALKIPPNKRNIVILLVCILIAIVLSLMGVETKVHRGLHGPEILLIALALLIRELRSVCLEPKSISIHYIPGVKRKIPLTRVHEIEFVSHKVSDYLLISLDNCPSFRESGQSFDMYVLRHPIKLIAVSVMEERTKEYVQAIKALYPNLFFME